MENFEKKNTVKATNQVSQNVFVLGDMMNGEPKIMFLGNSITKHGVAPQIGWHGDWGMGASSIENDYVHICMNKILKKYPDAVFCIVQGAVWERSYRNCNIDEYFKEASNFNPDVMICLLSENVINEDFDSEIFIAELHKFHKYLSGKNKNAKIIVCSNFFNNEEKTKALELYAEKYSTEFVFISDLILDEENLASKYEHEGIKIHPGDKGMRIIAERITEKIM